MATTDASSELPSNSNQIRNQWKNPSDILSLLLLVGSDIVQKALGQLAFQPHIPVAFSFGWVAYVFMALSAVLGEGKIMPEADCPARIINTDNGYTRDSRSWVLGRLIRDVNHWLDDDAIAKVDKIIGDAQAKEDADVKKKNAERDQGSPRKFPEKISKKGLCISVYQAGKAATYPAFYWRDGLMYVAVIGLAAQFGIAIAPCILYKQWESLLITAAGNILAFMTGLLPQWRSELWACRKLTDKTQHKKIGITRGNGAQHLIIIIGCEGAYNLEDLATGDAVPQTLTTTWFFATLCLWVALLITVSGIKSNTWYLVGVGSIGMLQNVLLSASPREPRYYGLNLTHKISCARWKVMGALMELDLVCRERTEDALPTDMAASLIPVFFPEGIRKAERIWWSPAHVAERRKVFDEGMWEKETKQEQLEDLRKYGVSIECDEADEKNATDTTKIKSCQCHSGEDQQTHWKSYS